MAHYAYKECCYDIDYPKFKELVAKFDAAIGHECDHDANYDGDYWLIAAMWINELRETTESQAKRIAELEAALSDATEAQQVLGLKLTHAEAEVAALRVDAGRYRWLRDVGDETWAPMSKRDPSGRVGAKEIDAAIDAAKEQQ